MDEHDVTNVIHLAALQVPFVREDPVLGSRVNVTGTVNVLEAVRRRGERMGPVVYASSIAAVEGDAAYPSTLYGVFKLANEGTAAGYFNDFGVSSVGLRPHTLYGPGRDQGLTSAPTAAMVAAAKGEAYEIPFGGSLQLQYTADAGEQFVRASEARVGGRVGAQPRRAGRERRGDHRGDRAGGAGGRGEDHLREGPAAVPVSSSTRARSPSSSAGRCRGRSRGRGRGDRGVQLSTAPSDAEPTDAP